ncbi:hypothetical protein [Legionella oakridgensis]|uniref:Uncharacterized protein n=2 Tax=Legionella oakridgensis TaxID=29423 RepID=W0BCX2_9GAMM|nr:hypothetical protein [Legionella oakridgensis]AHE66477.1 hypothetical protein Loa_00918 [Legionella oakridgensis ATCC 33761 = DSM 21215]KTD43952.1 hypothetical protein Loak_0502 [Legionella oakridgensis]STY19643.1 Uncharacterised protein [Legionella longbeachae]
MKRILAGVVMMLLTGMSLAQKPFMAGRDISGASTITILLETGDGMQVKAIVPKEEADKLKEVQPGDQVKLNFNSESLLSPGASIPAPNTPGIEE